MRSRILQYKNNLVDYDIFTQFPIKKYSCIPTLLSCTIQIKNFQANDLKQICSGLVAIQLIGNKYTLCAPQNSFASLSLSSTGINTYNLLESLLLLRYKNKLQYTTLDQTKSMQSTFTMHGKDLLSIVEYFSPYSSLLKVIEKTAKPQLRLSISYQLTRNKKETINSYFFKSLGYPLKEVPFSQLKQRNRN